jgi:phosphoribosylformylglycinamidine synthase
MGESKVKPFIQPPVTPELVAGHGLTAEEYQKIVALLGRAPNYTELGVFSVMWSEHCSYKSSRHYLKQLPTEGPRVLQGPGENAGVVDIGDGVAVAFKMESHNHPSAIEPYQGAATGVGGILRDIFTMGARPIASLNSLRFGARSPAHALLVSGSSPASAATATASACRRWAARFFDACYNANILVNAFTLGIARSGYSRIAKGRNGHLRWLKTGATVFTARPWPPNLSPKKRATPATVQVGDPFAESSAEACLELMEKDCIIGIQDMGAAGDEFILGDGRARRLRYRY